ncbi:MAG: hypothetical protein JSW43_02845 [Gemmatimonadota bacterium]|nr:MAG: hypothetical protein JSW43_02845 [Gemmatimonadota bacterium]
MRLSTALLADTPVRLADLDFPCTGVLLHRTRLAFIYLDKLLNYAKADRDGMVDGYIAVYMPDEVTVMLLRRGTLATVIAYTANGRSIRAIPAALEHFKKEAERGEIIYCAAPYEQLAWMYSSCSDQGVARPLNPRDAQALFTSLMQEGFSGVLELIVGGQVNYLAFEEGVLRSGHFHGDLEGDTVHQYVERLFAAAADESQVAALTFTPVAELPEQAEPRLFQVYRELFWAIADAAEQQVPGESRKRVERLRDLQANVHTSLAAIGTPLDATPDYPVATPPELMYALSDWVLQLLEELEVIAPGVAPDVLKHGTKEQRYMLQTAGFYDRLPWTVHW